MSEGGGFAPLLLLADSQPLFAGAAGPSVLERVLPYLPAAPRAAYLGASNGDEPAFYDLFAAAMEAVGVGEHAMVHSRYGDADRAWLEGADLVVLAGGDVERGWRIFEQSGIREALLERYASGAVLLGVSAGAVQLGCGYLGLVAGWVGAHEEGEGWAGLRRRMRSGGGRVRGLGVPFGGALIVHGDGEFEAVRRGVVELVFAGAGEAGEDGGGDGGGGDGGGGEDEDEDEDEIRESLLLPPD